MRFVVCAALLLGCAREAEPVKVAEVAGRTPQLHYFEINPM